MGASLRSAHEMYGGLKTSRTGGPGAQGPNHGQYGATKFHSSPETSLGQDYLLTPTARYLVALALLSAPISATLVRMPGGVYFRQARRISSGPKTSSGMRLP